MSEALPLTLRGKHMLEEELKRLIHEERPSVIKAIEAARANGDLSENADYDAAKERQGWIEARIGEIQGQLAGAMIVDTSKIKSDKIVFGAHVNLLDVEHDKLVSYQIVGVSEASVEHGRISIVSPLARALIGKRQGDEVEVKTPTHVKIYEVEKVYFE